MTETERIIELLQHNLQEVFGEGDAARRRAAIEEFYTDDCVLYVPTGVVVGHQALDGPAPMRPDASRRSSSTCRRACSSPAWPTSR